MGLVNQMGGHSKEVSQAAQPLQPLMKKKEKYFSMDGSKSTSYGESQRIIS